LKNKKKVLVCPLNWGLGHATRCIPLINQLTEKGFNVVIAASGRPLILLKEEFPELDFIDFPDYRISYPRASSLTNHIILQSPFLFFKIRKEHRQLNKIIEQNNINIVVSDNRYGLWTKKVYCIFITHQIMVKCPPALKFMENFLHLIIQKYINRYDECWIPDIQSSSNLSGDLSHKYKLPSNSKYVGWMSRFAEFNKTAITPNNSYELLAILSGPEPQRSFFEEILTNELKKSSLNCCIICGTPERKPLEYKSDNITYISHVNNEDFCNLINQVRYIICRPGYTSLMDLIALRKKAILIPTPGQTEQEYLSEILLAKGLFYSCRQENFNLQKVISESESYNNFPAQFPAECFFQLPDSIN
jgi:uncharacterized protein (TIGR00661 family)